VGSSPKLFWVHALGTSWYRHNRSTARRGASPLLPHQPASRHTKGKTRPPTQPLRRVGRSRAVYQKGASHCTHIILGAITVCEVLTHIVVCESAGLQHQTAASSSFRHLK
jgi:hypothetical protein